jgi:hypothetical protein
VVIATSVFTHMMPLDVAHYLSEMSRVLKPGGCCLTTWFLLNETSEAMIGLGRSAMEFPYALEGCRTSNPDVPEWAVAFDENRVSALFAGAGLVLEHPVRYGGWCGRTEYLSYQDICIATR